MAQIAPIANNSIPVMGSIPVIYQQQPGVVAVGGQQLQYAHKKPYTPRERNPNEEQCKIFVGAVAKHTTEETLRGYFSKFGEIADSVIMRDKMTAEPRGFAFVTFRNPESVAAVLEQCNSGGHTLDGKNIDPKAAVPQGPGQHNNLSTFANNGYDAEKAAAIKQEDGQQSLIDNNYKGPMKVSPELKVFVGGIGIGTTEEDVKKYFSSFGNVIQVDMPFHHIYKCPKGFVFVGFESTAVVREVCKNRYHQINGKTVEVKGADEQAQHFNKRREGLFAPMIGRGRGGFIHSHQPTAIGTVAGLGAYALPQQQMLVPQSIGGVTQYASVQVPQQQTGGYVFDPQTNTYYQLPMAPVLGAGNAQMLNQQFAQQGVYLAGGAGAQIRPGVTAEMLSGLAGGHVALGGVYSSETSQFGPARSHMLAGGAQQPMSGNAVDPHVVYSTSASISAGDGAGIPSQRGYHPYGR